jgi:hypothetical protein
MTLARCLALFAATGTVLLSSAEGTAQVSEHPALVQHRNNCRLAAQVLTSGEPVSKRAWARRYLAECPAEGPAVLTAQWRTATLSTEEIEQLTRSSLRLRDARLYRAMMSTAADRSRPSDVRAAAMLVLSRYVNVHSAVWLSQLVPPDSITRIRLPLGSSVDVAQVDGTEALGHGIGPEVLGLLERIGADRVNEPVRVWYAAARLARRVRSDMEFDPAL